MKCLFILWYIIQTIVSLSEIWGLVKKDDPRNQHISHDHKTQEKRFQTSSNPKNNILPSWKKNLTVLKKQQHMAGWGVRERNIVITFEHSLYRHEERGNFVGENVGRPQSISFESIIEDGKKQRRFRSRLVAAENQELNFTFDPSICWKEWKQEKVENPGFIRGFVSRTPGRLKQREEWNVLEHAYSQHQSPSVPIITLGCHHYVPRIWVSFEQNRISFKHTSLLGISTM